MASQIEAKQLVMLSVAFEEVQNKTPDCGDWLKDNNLQQLAVSNAILQDAKRIMGLLGIANDKYTTGVGENDILIISAARLRGAELVSDEARQPILPKISSNRKIPAVCTMPTVSVSCINFIEYIKASGAVFR